MVPAGLWATYSDCGVVAGKVFRARQLDLIDRWALARDDTGRGAAPPAPLIFVFITPKWRLRIMSEETTPKPNASQNSGGSSRRLILFAVLALLVVGLLYDRFVARPKVDQAYKTLTELHEITNRYGNPETMFVIQDWDEDGLLTGDEIAGRMRSDLEAIDTDGDGSISASELNAKTSLAPERIREALGREPNREFEEGIEQVEEYHFASGLPFRSHKLFAAYRKRGGQLVFYRHAKYGFEKSSDILRDESVIIPGVDEEEAQLEASDYGGGGAPAAGGSDAERPGGRGEAGGRPRFDPEQMFSNSDEDGDGTLAGDEIPERFRENLGEIDTDGDGAVTKEEFMARIEAMRAARGGGQGGRPSQPEAEESTGEEDLGGDEQGPDEPAGEASPEGEESP